MGFYSTDEVSLALQEQLDLLEPCEPVTIAGYSSLPLRMPHELNELNARTPATVATVPPECPSRISKNADCYYVSSAGQGAYTGSFSEATINQYAFCGSNPVNFTDPSGLSPEFSPGIGMWSGLTAGQHLGAARESAPFAGGVLAGMSGVGAVNGLAVWAVEVGISRGIVTGSLFTLAGVGAFGTFMDLYFDHSCDNIKYNAGLLLGGGSMASMSAGYLRGLLSPAGYTSSEATLASELGMAWRGPDGKISPAAFFSDWFNPNAPVNPMSTGPTVLGAAGASTLNSQGAGNMLR